MQKNGVKTFWQCGGEIFILSLSLWTLSKWGNFPLCGKFLRFDRMAPSAPSYQNKMHMVKEEDIGSFFKFCLRTVQQIKWKPMKLRSRLLAIMTHNTQFFTFLCTPQARSELHRAHDTSKQFIYWSASSFRTTCTLGTITEDRGKLQGQLNILVYSLVYSPTNLLQKII